MTDLIDTTEMYLRTVYELEEEGIVPLRARIAERIGHSGPTVSQTVARMERDGLVKVRDDRHLDLTPVGRERATRVMRKHRLAERLLTDVIGLDWAYVHDEACRWEHVMSEAVERRLVEVLDRPTVSPYGSPIPALGELGVDREDIAFLAGVERLHDAVPAVGRPAAPGRGVGLPRGPRPAGASGGPVGGPGESGGPHGTGRDRTDRPDRVVRVVRLGESLQTDPDLLARFAAAGAVPGQSVAVRVDPERSVWQLGGNGIVLELDRDAAGHVFVTREGTESEE